jgi:hypothetical protein
LAALQRAADHGEEKRARHEEIAVCLHVVTGPWPMHTYIWVVVKRVCLKG